MTETSSREQVDPKFLRLTVEQATRLASGAEQRFRALLETLPDAIVIVDREGRIALINSQTELMFGYARNELLGQRIEMLLPHRFRSSHVGHRLNYAAEHRTRPMGTGLDLYALRKDGTEFPVEISLSTLETDDGILVTSVIRDITERRRVEETLERQARLLELSHDAVIVRDPDSRIVYWNRGARDLYGFRKSEAEGQKSHDLLRTVFPDSVEAVDRHLDEHGRWDGELIHRRRDGAEVVVESRQVIVRDTDGRPRATLEINRDISERRAVERMQREFIAMVSHELMNPVTGIGLHAEILQLTEAYSAQAVEGILGSARRLERLIGDLLDVSRLDTGRLKLQPRRIDFVALLRGCVEQARASSSRHTVKLTAPRRPLYGWWDPVRLEQVCHNLLGNAVKYSPDGGRVTVVLERVGDEAKLSIQDEGPGIPADELPYVFERFFRARTAERQAQGLGLGLYITRSLVEAHGGHIRVESKPGAGACFTVTLPIGSAAAD